MAARRTSVGVLVVAIVAVAIATGCTPPPTTPDDFSIEVNPPTVRIIPTLSTSVNVATAVTDGSAEPIALSATGLPLGTMAWFSPPSVTSGGSATLNIDTSLASVPGTWTVTVTGTAPSGAHSTTFDFTIVNETIDFTMGLSPTSVTVTHGGSATTTVSTALAGGVPQNIALSASGLPAGATASFSPPSVTTLGSSALTVATTAATPPGTYPVTVTATSPTATHTATLTLIVT